MMSEFKVFGDPDRFQLAIRWADDREPRSRRPSRHGWSMGDIKITVAGQVLTRRKRGGRAQEHVGWYLAPMFGWIAENWIFLLHEEDFAWTEKSAAPAAVACHRAIDKWIAARDDSGRAHYARIQAWYQRHALRAASEGGLFPDFFVRRFLDDVEVSWSADPPFFAPDGFMFASEPGMARLAVEDVAVPLWEALVWAASRPPHLERSDLVAWKELAEKIESLPRLPEAAFERAYAPETVLSWVADVLRCAARPELLKGDISPKAPFVAELSPAVAMFGGVSPNLGHRDIEFLCAKLIGRQGLAEDVRLSRLVADRRAAPLGVPHRDGYEFAADFIDETGLLSDIAWIDVRDIADRFGIEISEHMLETETIRGVAIAGEGFGPSILINTRSFFNANEDGKRFTIAHELCHILHDRTRARRVTHVSGPWVAPGIEKRANAFAAYLLMPRELVLRHMADKDGASDENIHKIARLLHVSESALVEHLYNMDFIGDWDRERLRASFRPN
jgi:Zn-dependent peptidase ImmA (M78 family)